MESENKLLVLCWTEDHPDRMSFVCGVFTSGAAVEAAKETLIKADKGYNRGRWWTTPVQGLNEPHYTAL